MAGFDQKFYLTPSEKYKLAIHLQLGHRRVDGKAIICHEREPGRIEKRHLAISTIEDRARQRLVVMALEPECGAWRRSRQPNSYGFRPGRSCHDAVEAIFLTHRKTPNSGPRFIIDADLKGCIDHSYLLKKLSTLLAIYAQVKAWLKAEIFE